MTMIVYVLSLAVGGLLVGALGRFAVPGPNPMSIGRTILVGLAGSFVGGTVGALLFGGRSGGSLIFAVLAAALIVWLLERRRPAVT